MVVLKVFMQVFIQLIVTIIPLQVCPLFKKFDLESFSATVLNLIKHSNLIVSNTESKFNIMAIIKRSHLELKIYQEKF